ncbi:organic solute transporter subunit beta [Sarcophilus harrisii]|uniref:SLC51 subunit beta n=1 Tax=Sarcophilus harrisii TaxID=9305 RepID=G3W919_SARHA|nr:organic solute transporter subunit beta [Sarcophilus harrisii]XP_031811233.1 organic solute transporter subunit beta [Sarcophilus harrisii]
MDGSDGHVGALSGPGWSEEELEELLWLYRADDSTPWNIAVLVLSCAVLILNVFLLGRSIMANRKRKMNSQDEQEMKTKSSSETANNKEDPSSPKDGSSLNVLKETLLSQNQNPEQTMIEWKEKAHVDIALESSEYGV